ncbi:hypothetical protein FQR65_LT05322 [Abscondita terminalis]|nr:hypothetical protein FQR65_LT05322 [Abscondita terminalis]
MIIHLIMADYPANKKHVLFTKISKYCNKPSGPIVPVIETELSWTYYYSIFFVLTVISTIGFGGLSPSTPFTKAFTIVYGIIGIPINGIVVITLGGFFGMTFRKVYRRWKAMNKARPYTTLGLILKILGYFIPGLALLIIIPSGIIVIYEDWTFDRALAFAFGTLTTIGTGDYIPGTMQREQTLFVYVLYKGFLLVWIVMGLGYLAMFFTFIAEGLQSKKIISLEHKFSKNIRKTNKKIRKELRYLLNDYLFSETYVQPVYRERRLNALVCTHQRTQSCPDLFQAHEDIKSPVKKRAISALPALPSKTDSKMKSDTDLHNIDKIKTFEQKISRQHHELLIKVVSALSNYNDLEYTTTITSGELNDRFESDDFDMDWMFEKNPLGVTPQNREQESIEYDESGKTNRNRTLQLGESIFCKLKRTIRKSISSGDKPIIERDCVKNGEDNTVVQDGLDNDNSLSDFLRALSIIDFNAISRPLKQKRENVVKIRKKRRLPIIPTLGRFSGTSSNGVRRFYSESCSSIPDNIDSFADSAPTKNTPKRRRTRSVIGLMQRLRSTSKHKNSVVINIDQ